MEKILFYLMEREKELAQILVNQALLGDPNAILTNAAHEEISKTLQQLCTQAIQKPRLRICK